MHFDALTLAAIADELHATVVGGRVQQLVMTGPHAFGLEVYGARQRMYLVLSATPTAARIHLAAQKVRRGVEEQPPLLLLLRKYVRGALLTAAHQPDRTERVLRLDFSHPEHGTTTLVAEPMGRSANLILLDPSARILDALHRVRPDDRGSRVILPNHTYSPPPEQAKLPPLDDGSGDYYARLGALLAQPGPLWRVLVTHVAGMSPSAAREAAWRATGAIDTPATKTDLLPLVQALQELWQPAAPAPSLWLDGETIVGFSAYVGHVKGAFAPTTSMSGAVERFYAERGAEQQIDGYAAQRAAVARALTAAMRKVDRRLAALAGDLPTSGEVERLRRDAEWLLALSSQIAPGQRILTVEMDEEAREIELDSARTPVEQAQRMFKRAGKLERATRFVPQRQAQLQSERNYLDQLQFDLSLAENQPEIAAIQDELRAMGLTSRQRTPKSQGKRGDQSGQPLRYTSATGFEIVVGRNARQNELVTFRVAAADDPWLHVRDVPGAHVVVRRRGRQPDDATLLAAAQLAAYYSKARGERAADVMVTEARLVSRASGGRTGQVTVRSAKTITAPGEVPDAVTLST